MRIKTKDAQLEFAAVTPHSQEMRMQDVAALQRETGWKMSKIQEMGQLEIVALQLMIFFTWRANRRLISFERAGELIDEVDFLEDPGDEELMRKLAEDPGEEQGPTPAPTGSVRGDDADAAAQPNEEQPAS